MPPTMKRGPKGPTDESPLMWRPRGTPSQRFGQFSKKFLVIPKGRGVGGPMVLQPWQLDLMAEILDGDVRPSVVGVMMPRGQGKTALMGCWALYEAFTGPYGNQIVMVASSERQAHLLFDAVAQMVGLSEELSSRCAVYRDRIEIPGKGASIAVMPAEGKLLEGLGNFTLALADEIGVIPKDTWETLLLGLGKQDNATVCGIGTPSNASESVLLDLRDYAQGDGAADETFKWIEYSADAFAGVHEIDCRHCWLLANPAMDPAMGKPFVIEAQMAALLPPKTTPGGFARAKLCQFVIDANPNPFIPADVWETLRRPGAVPDGTDVVVALDGSWGGKDSDATALVVGTISPTPHFDIVQVWESDGTADYRIPVLQVEQAVRDAGKRWRVKELVMDPFRWGRTGQVLQSEGFKVVEFPWSPSRTTKATTELYSAATAGKFTHSGDEILTRHVMAATVIENNGGLRIGKVSRKRGTAKIDCAAALLMCHSRCAWLGTRRRRNRVIGV